MITQSQYRSLKQVKNVQEAERIYHPQFCFPIHPLLVHLLPRAWKQYANQWLLQNFLLGGTYILHLNHNAFGESEGQWNNFSQEDYKTFTLTNYKRGFNYELNC